MKKVRISPLQNRIIWILEEAREETKLTIISTLKSDGGYDEHAFREALQGLERLGYIRCESESAIITVEGYAALSK